jgi:hypothetical protein
MGYHKVDKLQTAPDHTSLRVILRDSSRAKIAPSVGSPDPRFRLKNIEVKDIDNH